MMQTSSLLMLVLGYQGFVSGSVLPQPQHSNSDNAHLFASPDLAIPEAPAANQLTLGSHPNPDIFNSPARARVRAMRAQYEKKNRRAVDKINGNNNRRRWRIWGRKVQPSGMEVSSNTGTVTDAITNTLFSGVYPVVNVTWGNKAGEGAGGQSFVSYIDTGSSDTFAVSKRFRCQGLPALSTEAFDKRSKPSASAPSSLRASNGTLLKLSQATCNFGRLYDIDKGNFTNITTEAFSISYFPENESLDGSMVLAPITVGGLTVPQQQVAIVESAIWTGDSVASGLLGLSFPALTSGKLRKSELPAPEYDPFFTSLAKQTTNGQNVMASAVFTLAIDRVPRGTPYWQAAGTLALGGLVPSSYYDGNFTSVPIEPPWILRDPNSPRSFYATTVQVVYGPPGTNITSTATSEASIKTANLSTSAGFQTIVDSGTSPNFVTTKTAVAINKMFDPPAKFNATLNYYVVDCNAKVPFVAYRIGGKTVNNLVTGGVLMPIDPRDMIVRSLNGLPGYDNVCFSSIANGGDAYGNQQIIGATWQRSYVVAYDQGRNMMHFAKRRPY